MSKYSIGLDFGTLSARAVIVDVETGFEMATSVFLNILQITKTIQWKF